MPVMEVFDGGGCLMGRGGVSCVDEWVYLSGMIRCQ